MGSEMCIRDRTETAQLMAIEMGEFYQDKTIPTCVKTNKVAISSNPKKQGESETSNDGHSESIIDVMDSLIRIFEPKIEEPRAKKRKKNDISRNNKGTKYLCQQCNYEAGRLDNLKIHVEAIHEGVRYSCNQCSY